MSQTPPVVALNHVSRVSCYCTLTSTWFSPLGVEGWRTGQVELNAGLARRGSTGSMARPHGRWTVSFNMTERVRALQPGSTQISTGMQPLARATGAGSRWERSYEAQIHSSDTSHRHAQVYSYIPQSTPKILFCYLQIHVSSNSAIGCSQVHPFPVWKNYST